MAIKYKTRVKEVASNKPDAVTAFNLPATTATGFRTFVSAYASTEKLPYHATNGTDWESGIGIFTDGTPGTVTRTTILESSNGDAAVDFSSGADVDIFVEWAADIANKVHNTGAVIVTCDGSTTQTFSNGTDTKVAAILATEVTDPNGWWNTSTTRFEPDVAGTYLITASISLSTFLDQEHTIISLRKNGAAYKLLGRFDGSSVSSYTCQTVGSAFVTLNGTTDYIELYFKIITAADKTSQANAERNYFNAVRIGD